MPIWSLFVIWVTIALFLLLLDTAIQENGSKCLPLLLNRVQKYSSDFERLSNSHLKIPFPVTCGKQWKDYTLLLQDYKYSIRPLFSVTIASNLLSRFIDTFSIIYCVKLSIARSIILLSCVKLLIWVLKTLFFTYVQIKKSRGVISGDIWSQFIGPCFRVQFSSNTFCKTAGPSQLVCIGAPSCWN